MPGEALDAGRMPGHWLLARLGKRVLRPGGVEMTRQLLDGVAIGPADDVIEVAPGLGATTRLLLESGPASYTGIDRDPASADLVAKLLDECPNRRVVQASAAEPGLPDDSADVVFGEAYLTMQPHSQKQRIVSEMGRVLRTGGRFAMHEVAFAPDDIAGRVRIEVAAALRTSIKVNVSPLTVRGWRELLEENGFRVERTVSAPLHLLEPKRLVADEGVRGAARFAFNVLRDGDARSRVVAMRRAMRSNAAHLQAFGIVASCVGER